MQRNAGTNKHTKTCIGPINNDLTVQQQNKHKVLRDEYKSRKNAGEDVIIYKGNVILRKDVRDFH